MTTAPRQEPPAGPSSGRGRLGGWLRDRPADVVDLFVYVVVLNLAIEFLPSVISESFTLSLLTALLLKVALELVIMLKAKILGRLKAATTRRAKVVAALSLWVVAVQKARRPLAGGRRLRGQGEPRGLHPGDAARPRPPGIEVGRTPSPGRQSGGRPRLIGEESADGSGVRPA